VVANSDTAYAALSSLGLVYINLRRFDDARAALDNAIAMRPNEFSAYYNRGLLEEISADTAAAIADYETAVRNLPGADDIYTRLVQLYQWSGQPLKGIEAAKNWERENPNAKMAPFLMGTCYYMVEANEDALRAFERALRLDPKHALTCYYIASTYRKTGKLDLAMQYARKAASLDTQLALPYLEQVYIAADQGDRETAVRATSEYLKRAPSDSGMAYLQQFMK
jgi:tetratricopeptide (TPR) repeat protein